MLDPEVYAGAHRRADGGWATSKYSDQFAEALDASAEVLPWQRQPLYCVRVPGEAAWVAGESAPPAASAAPSPAARTVPGHFCWLLATSVAAMFAAAKCCSMLQASPASACAKLVMSCCWSLRATQ